MPSEYEFGTEANEVMEMLSGELEVLLPGSTDFKPVSGGDSFEVPANSKFQVKIHAMINYCSSYGCSAAKANPAAIRIDPENTRTGQC